MNTTVKEGQIYTSHPLEHSVKTTPVQVENYKAMFGRTVSFPIFYTRKS